MSRVSRSVSEAMRVRYCSFFAAGSGPFRRRRSTKRLIDVSGVFSSCDTLVTNVAFCWASLISP